MQIPSISRSSCEYCIYFKEQLDPDRVRGVFLILLLLSYREPHATDSPFQTVSKLWHSQERSISSWPAVLLSPPSQTPSLHCTTAQRTGHCIRSPRCPQVFTHFPAPGPPPGCTCIAQPLPILSPSPPPLRILHALQHLAQAPLSQG